MTKAVNVRASIAWAVVEAGVTLASSLAMILIVARAIGPAAFGIASIAFFVTSIVETFISTPFYESLIRWPTFEEEITDTAFASMATVGLVAYALLVAFAPHIADAYHHPELFSLIAVQGLTCIALGLRGAVEAELARGLQFKSLAIRGIAAKTISTVLSTILAYAGAGSWSIILGNVTFAIVSLILVWYAIERRPKFRIYTASLKDLLGFGVFSLADAILTILMSRLFGLLIAERFGLSAFGQTSAAFRINDSLVSLLASGTTRIALPMFSQVQGDPRGLVEMWAKGTQITIFLSAPVFIGICFVSSDFINLSLGPQWAGASNALVAVSIYSLFNFASILVQPALKATGRPALLLIIHFVSLISLYLLFLGLSSHGFDTALYSYSLSGLVYWLTALSVFAITFKDRVWFRIRQLHSHVLSSAVMIFALLLLGRYTPTLTSPLRLVLTVSLGALTYSFMSILCNRDSLAKFFRARRAKRR